MEDSALAEPIFQSQQSLKLAWWPVPISARSITLLADSLIVFAAVLLFTLLSIWNTGVFPSWPGAVALVLGVSAIFSLVYWFLCRAANQGTLGQRLAQLAFGANHEKEEDRPRFR